MVQGQSAGSKGQGEQNILRVLFVPITIAVLVLAFSIHEGLAYYPTAPEHQSFLPSGTYEDGIITKAFSTPGLASYKAFSWSLEKKAPVSPWHDINLYPKNTKNLFQYVVEIPRGTHAKLEIQTGEYLNPIVQDKRDDGTLRFVYDPYPFHYGAFPQTWENPFTPDHWTGIVGDKDPLDILDLGYGVYSPGDIVTVKVIGILGLLGHGDETDWKVVAIDVNDPQAEKYNDVSELTLEQRIAIVEFFKFYTIHDGEHPNTFAFNEEILNHTFAVKVIENKHDEWKRLIRGDVTDAGAKNFHTSCVLCPEAKTKKEFKANEVDARKWAEQEAARYLKD